METEPREPTGAKGGAKASEDAAEAGRTLGGEGGGIEGVGDERVDEGEGGVRGGSPPDEVGRPVPETETAPEAGTAGGRVGTGVLTDEPAGRGPTAADADGGTCRSGTEEAEDCAIRAAVSPSKATTLRSIVGRKNCWNAAVG